MKLTLHANDGRYEVEEGSNEPTLDEVLDLVERLLITAGYAVKPGTITINDEEN